MLPFFLLVGQRRGQIQAGLIVGIVQATLSIIAPFAGWIADRIGPRLISTGGMLAVAGSYTLLQWAGPDSGMLLLMTALALSGVGLLHLRAAQ